MGAFELLPKTGKSVDNAAILRGPWKEDQLFPQEAAMDIKGYRQIPRALFDAIKFLAEGLAKRSVPTFLELLFGAMLTQTGFVTDAILAVDTVRHWNSYYKWLHFGRCSWVDLGRQMARLALRMFSRRRWFLMIDDTIVFKWSKKAPDSAIHHQHGKKTIARPLPEGSAGWHWL